MLRRDQGDRAEFITLSLWESVDAIRAFAGDDIEAAVLYPEDEHYLLGGESTVTHYQVVDQVEASGSGEETWDSISTARIDRCRHPSGSSGVTPAVLPSRRRPEVFLTYSAKNLIKTARWSSAVAPPVLCSSLMILPTQPERPSRLPLW
jgi:hypothetical protein